MGDFKQHDQIYVLAESKLNTIADRISVALNNAKISEEEISLILSDKYNQMIERRYSLPSGMGHWLIPG